MMSVHIFMIGTVFLAYDCMAKGAGCKIRIGHSFEGSFEISILEGSYMLKNSS